MYVQLDENKYVISYIEHCDIPPDDYIYVEQECTDDFIKNFEKYKYSRNKLIYNDTKYKRETLEKTKQEKIIEMSKECENTIHNGIDIQTTQGIEHFSLTEKDQINISSCYNMALQGHKQVLYHADSNLCRLFTYDEIMFLMQKATEHITYHTTYFNHLKNYINSFNDTEDVKNINYGCKLSDDLQAHMTKMLGGDSN